MSKTTIKTERNIRPVIYRDFFTDFSMHAATGELNSKTNEEAVKQSIRNLLLTDRYERPFQPYIGSGLKGMLFEQYTPATELMITNSVKEVISNHEPRANLINVISSPAQGGTAITVTVVFSIINNPDPVQLSVILERMR